MDWLQTQYWHSDNRHRSRLISHQQTQHTRILLWAPCSRSLHSETLSMLHAKRKKSHFQNPKHCRTLYTVTLQTVHPSGQTCAILNSVRYRWILKSKLLSKKCNVKYSGSECQTNLNTLKEKKNNWPRGHHVEALGKSGTVNFPFGNIRTHCHLTVCFTCNYGHNQAILSILYRNPGTVDSPSSCIYI